MTPRGPAIRPRMRPTFAVELTADPAVFFDRLRESLAAQDAPFTGQVLTNHALVKVPRDRRTLLSPCLNLELDE